MPLELLSRRGTSHVINETETSREILREDNDTPCDIGVVKFTVGWSVLFRGGWFAYSVESEENMLTL